MTGTEIGAFNHLYTGPDGLARFNPGRDLRPVIELLELGFGDDLEARDRRWLAELNVLAGAGPLLNWMAQLFPPARGALSGFVFYADGKLVGNASLMRSSSDVWVVANVVTHPDYRRRGVAARLMDATLDSARARGARQIQLQVRSQNDAAQTLYRNLGFWRMNAASTLRLRSPGAARTLGVTPSGWSLYRPGFGDKEQIRRLLARAGEIDRGGPAGLVMQYYERQRVVDALDDMLAGRKRNAWAAMAGGEFRALMVAQAQGRQPPHRLDLVVDPFWEGRVEAPLLDAAMQSLKGQAPYEVEMEVDVRRGDLLAALSATGFRVIRTLDRLALDLNPAV